MEAGPFTYLAFVSYSSKDRPIGERFHRELERYTLPKPLRGRITAAGMVPKRLTPLFRDRSDLEATSNLGQRITQALESSRALIVLCSPRSAASKWVNKEIATFKQLGRKDRVIAVILDGDPVEYDPYNYPNGAFPKALTRRVDATGNIQEAKEEEIFAPDLREARQDGRGGDGFEYAKLKVISRLIEIPLAELTQRHVEVERSQRRVTRLIASGMFALAISATVGGILAWRSGLDANNRLEDAIETAARQVNIAAQYRDRYGVPAAVVEELLNSAEKDFERLVVDAGSSPNLTLQRVNLRLGFASQYDLIGDTQSRIPALLEAVKSDLDAIEAGNFSIAEILGLARRPSGSDVAIARMRLYDASASRFALQKDIKSALAEANLSAILAKEWLATTQEPTWRRHLADSYALIGRLHYEGGDLLAAKRSYERSIAEFDVLFKNLTSSPDQLAEISTLTDLAIVLAELDEREEAFKLQKRGSEIARDLVQRNPQDAEFKRTLIVALTRLGDETLALRMSPQAALPSYEEALPISRTLTAADPARVDWQRDRYIVLERFGSAHLQSADSASGVIKATHLTKAEQALLEAIEIVERLVEIDPQNLEWRRDRSVAYEVLAQIRLAQQREASDAGEGTKFLEEADRASTKSISDREYLLSLDPQDTVARLDLGAALIQLGTIKSLRPSTSNEALSALARALQLMDELTLTPDAPAIWRRDRIKILFDRANVYLGLRRYDEALYDLGTALTSIRSLRAEFPQIEQYSRDEADLQHLIDKLQHRSPKQLE